MVVLRMWLGTYGARSWRRFGYLLLGLPMGVAGVLLAAVGRSGTADRCWRRLATGVAGVPPERVVPPGWRVAAGSAGAVVTGVAGWLMVQWFAFILLINIAYPFRGYLMAEDHAENVGALPWLDFAPHAPTRAGNIWASTYHGSWGGPTLAGAWAVHAALTLLLLFPIVAWLLRGLARLQLRLAGGPGAVPA